MLCLSFGVIISTSSFSHSITQFRSVWSCGNREIFPFSFLMIGWKSKFYQLLLSVAFVRNERRLTKEKISHSNWCYEDFVLWLSFVEFHVSSLGDSSTLLNGLPETHYKNCLLLQRSLYKTCNLKFRAVGSPYARPSSNCFELCELAELSTSAGSFQRQRRLHL